MTENEHDVDIANTILIDLDKTDKFNWLNQKRKSNMACKYSSFSAPSQGT